MFGIIYDIIAVSNANIWQTFTDMNPNRIRHFLMESDPYHLKQTLPIVPQWRANVSINSAIVELCLIRAMPTGCWSQVAFSPTVTWPPGVNFSRPNMTTSTTCSRWAGSQPINDQQHLISLWGACVHVSSRPRHISFLCTYSVLVSDSTALTVQVWYSVIAYVMLYR